MKRKTVVCIDSFKFEYLKHAPFLRGLTRQCRHGRLKVPIGFWGGMETFFKGKSDTLAFFYYSKNSSLKWTKYFTWMGKWPLNLLINFVRLLRREELFLTHAIPLEQLSNLETAIKKPMHLDSNFNYVLIGFLDKTAHECSTESRETIEAIKRVDKILSRMDFDVVMSDHGMIDVKETVEVPETDACFLDSTMARYWGSKRKMSEIKKQLPMKKGKIIKWHDKRFGDLIFLANPSVLILPNYWQGDEGCRGMHGYSAECKDMHGFYIIRRKGKRRNIGFEELGRELT